jgi:histone deacetylase 11
MHSAVVYSPHYDITFFGVERLHPFDSRKYGRAWRALREQFGRGLDARRLTPSGPVSDSDLRTVHTDQYLDTHLRSPAHLARALEVPQVARAPRWLIDWRVLRPMRWATAGTILAAREAVRTGGVVMNLSGGYHHAGRDRGEGFCLYADVGVAVAVLRRDGLLKSSDRVVHVDLDAHQGNGVARVFADDPAVSLFDQYNRHIYPNDAAARARLDRDVPVGSGCSDERYLDTLRAELPGFLDDLAATPPNKPRLAFYNAGTDVLAGDPLGRMNVSAEGVFERDRFVIELLAARGIPCVVLPSGGYTRESYRLLARTAGWVLDTAK